MSNEDKVRKDYADAGVDVPELKDTPNEEADKAAADAKAKEEAEAAEKAKQEAEAKAKADKEADEPLHEQPKEPRKRSIYDDLKDERKTRKDAETRAAEAEKQRDELKAQLEALNTAKTPEERKGAQDDIDAFLSKHKEWNKEAIAELIGIARGGTKPELDDALKNDLAEFKAWKASNSKAIEQQMFNDEFERVVPSIKSYFPTVTEDELKTIKAEVDTISHTKEWHDKDLDYVVFKNKDKLGALVSPKKRGMESKERKEIAAGDWEFDPNADISKMSSEEFQKWESEYRKLGKSDGVLTDAQGRKTII